MAQISSLNQRGPCKEQRSVVFVSLFFNISEELLVGLTLRGMLCVMKSITSAVDLHVKACKFLVIF